MNLDTELTLLSEEEIWGANDIGEVINWPVNGGRQLEVLDKYGRNSVITDLVILTGGYCEDSCTYMAPDDNSLKGRTGWCFTRSSDGCGGVLGCNEDGFRFGTYLYERSGAVRPVLKSSVIFNQISPNRVSGYNGTEEVEYGEYPQYAPDERMQKELEREFKNGSLRATGGKYTFDKTRQNDFSQYFQPITYEEFEYQGKKYIRVEATYYNGNRYKLSNGIEYHDGDPVWVEVAPVKWLIDDKTETLISKRGLLAGIRFHTDDRSYNGNFSTTYMKEYLDKYLLRDLTQTAILKMILEENEKEQFGSLVANDNQGNEYHGKAK